MKSSSLMSQQAAAVMAQALSQTDEPVTSPRASLRQLLDLNSWLDCPRAAEIALGVLEALEDAYRCGAPHVALQPENIFISDTGKVSFDESGSPLAAQYLSPEEARGEPADERSDLYRLGVVLYEMLTDRVPFDGNNATTIKRKHLYRSPEPPQVFRSDLPHTLSQLVMRLLEKDPARRLSRTELSVELRRSNSGQAAGLTSEEIDDSDDLGADETFADLILADWPPMASIERAAEEIETTHHLAEENNAIILHNAAVMSEPLEQAFASTMPAHPAEEMPARPSGSQHLLNILRQFAWSMKRKKGSYSTSRSDQLRHRLLTLVLTGILVCATLQLYELNEMSSPKSKEAAAPFTGASALSPSPAATATGLYDAAGHQPEAAGSETQTPTQKVAPAQANSLVTAPPASQPHAPTVSAVHATSSARTTGASRRVMTARNPLRPSRFSSYYEWQRYNARGSRYVGTKATGKPTGRDSNYKNDNRKGKASPATRKKRGWTRRFLFLPGRR